jgi:hypothetical protein
MKRALRRSKTLLAIKKQLRIAKLRGIPALVAGKFKKKHALDCGNPRCLICGNPRKLWKATPIKEQSTKEDTETGIETE